MANAQGIEVLSPVGRLVQGSPWELSLQTEDDGKTPKIGDDGKPVLRCYFAIAVPKDSPEWPAFWALLHQAASSGYPQYFANGQTPGFKEFAWKVTDGDGFDKYGKPNREKPGFAGCWVIKFSSSFLPRCYEKGKYAKHEQLQDARTIKLGYFVRVGAIVRANLGSKTHGLYINADLVSLEYVGEEITFGRDASAAFASAPQSTYVPPGAQQLPAGGMPGMSAPGAGMPQGMGGASMPGSPAGMMPQPMMGGAPGAMPNMGMPGAHGVPGTTVQPNTGFVAGAMQAAGIPNAHAAPGAMAQSPQMGGVPMPSPGGAMMSPSSGPRLVATPKANGYTREQFIANGFNDQMLVEPEIVRADA